MQDRIDLGNDRLPFLIRVILAQRMPDESIVQQDTAQVGMPFEIDPEHVEAFALQPVGGFPQRSRAGNPCVLRIDLDLNSQAEIATHRSQMIDDVETRLAGEPIHCGEIEEELAGELRVIVERAEYLRRRVAGDDEGILAVDALSREDRGAEFLLESFQQHRRVRILRLVPVERAALPCVDQADEKYRDKDQRLDKTKHPETAKLHRPWVKENYFDIENQEQQRGQIEAHREAAPRASAGRITTFKGFLFDRRWTGRADQRVDRNHHADDDARYYQCHQYRKPGHHYPIPEKARPIAISLSDEHGFSNGWPGAGNS